MSGRERLRWLANTGLPHERRRNTRKSATTQHHIDTTPAKQHLESWFNIEPNFLCPHCHNLLRKQCCAASWRMLKAAAWRISHYHLQMQHPHSRLVAPGQPRTYGQYYKNGDSPTQSRISTSSLMLAAERGCASADRPRMLTRMRLDSGCRGGSLPVPPP